MRGAVADMACIIVMHGHREPLPVMADGCTVRVPRDGLLVLNLMRHVRMNPEHPDEEEHGTSYKQNEGTSSEHQKIMAQAALGVIDPFTFPMNRVGSLRFFMEPFEATVRPEEVCHE
jgi:hypothetical protein